ncbi:MAG TPA: hypothetical protein VGD73_05605 [Pseudonocardia sp.]|uniref:hypothetical protein n=1 Tax=Pseudonocardia sp. TaxID=60912 RepID=UPI002ED80878
MFRRRREASFRAPASSAWWPAGASSEDLGSNLGGPGLGGSDLGGSGLGGSGLGSRPGALPSGDPFGGWPAFPAGIDPTDPVLGEPGPLEGWGTPVPPKATGGHPGPPAAVMPAQSAPITVNTAGATGATAGAAAAGPSTGGASEAPTSWMPLLTHADDGQPVQASPENPDAPVEQPGADPIPAAHPEPRRVRAARRRAARARRAADQPPPEPAATPRTAAITSPPARVVDPLCDPSFANGATTWLNPVVPPNPMEAAALAGAFAADYLSWDESSPDRRGQVLAQYLPSDVSGSPALLGWSGKGRQRAEFSLPGAVHPDGDGRVVVDVRVRVTPYRAVGQPAEPAPAGELEVAGVPAVAPAPTARGWKSLDSYWVRLTVPITYDQGRLVVDTWDEQLGGQDGEPTSADQGAAGGGIDPATADDLDDELDTPLAVAGGIR